MKGVIVKSQYDRAVKCVRKRRTSAVMRHIRPQLHTFTGAAWANTVTTSHTVLRSASQRLLRNDLDMAYKALLIRM